MSGVVPHDHDDDMCARGCPTETKAQLEARWAKWRREHPPKPDARKLALKALRLAEIYVSEQGCAGNKPAARDSKLIRRAISALEAE